MATFTGRKRVQPETALFFIGGEEKKPKLPKPPQETKPLKDPQLYLAWSVQHYFGKITLESIAEAYNRSVGWVQTKLRIS